MQTNTKKWLASLSTTAIAITMLGAWAPNADARMVFSTEEGSTNADSYTIDYDDSAGTGDVILRFGTTVDKTISYDNANGNFKINDAVSFEENEALNFVLENNNGEVATCNNTRYGRLYYDTSDNGTYVCTSLGWVDLSKMDGLTADDFLSSNGDDNYSGTGTLSFDAGTTLAVSSGATLDADDATVNMNGITNNSFILDEDNTGGDVVLQFGSTLAEAITWDDSMGRFDFSDDVYINGDLEITGTFTGDLADNTVETNDLQDSAVTTDKIATGAVTSNEIENGTITASDIAANTITASEIASNTITASEIATNAITSDELADNSVDTNAVQNYAITSNKIGTGAVTTDKIADGAITSDKIGSGAITVDNIANNTITGDKIQDGSITNNDIANNTIDLSKMADRNKSTLISPEYPNFTLYGDTTNNSGTLDSDRDTSSNKNYYSWTSRKTVLNDYDIMVQFQIPDDFSSWQANAINFTYKTDETGTTDNNIQVYVLDTTGALTYTGSTLASTTANTWTSTNVTTVNLSSGTYTAGQYMTIGIKLSSRRDNGSAVGAPRAAYAGELKMNYVGK